MTSRPCAPRMKAARRFGRRRSWGGRSKPVCRSSFSSFPQGSELKLELRTHLNKLRRHFGLGCDLFGGCRRFGLHGRLVSFLAERSFRLSGFGGGPGAILVPRRHQLRHVCRVSRRCARARLPRHLHGSRETNEGSHDQDLRLHT